MIDQRWLEEYGQSKERYDAAYPAPGVELVVPVYLEIVAGTDWTAAQTVAVDFGKVGFLRTPYSWWWTGPSVVTGAMQVRCYERFGDRIIQGRYVRGTSIKVETLSTASQNAEIYLYFRSAALRTFPGASSDAMDAVI